MADDLVELDEWLRDFASHLSPRERKKLAMKIGQQLRRSNAGRIASNTQPDGSKMAPRKPRLRSRNADKGKRGRMFRKIAKVKNLRVRAEADGVEIFFESPLIAKTAAEHHFGQEGYVGKGRDGKTIRTRYAERRLLGVGTNDAREIIDAAIDHLGRG